MGILITNESFVLGKSRSHAREKLHKVAKARATHYYFGPPQHGSQAGR